MTSFTSRLVYGGWNVFDRPQSRDSQNLDDLLSNSSQHSNLSGSVASEFQNFFGGSSSHTAPNTSNPSNHGRRKVVSEMNIFGSNIVSREFILERMQQVEDNKAIVRLVFEDMIDQMDTQLMVATMDVLTCDNRKWRRIKFLDSIDLLQFKRWNERRLVLLNHLKDEGGEYPLLFQANFEFSLEKCNEDDMNNLITNHQSNHEVRPLSDFLYQDGAEFVASHPRLPNVTKLIKLFRDIRKEKNVRKLKFGGDLYLLEAENGELWEQLVKLVLPTKDSKFEQSDQNGQEGDSSDSSYDASTTTSSSKVAIAVLVRSTSFVSPTEDDEGLNWRMHMERTLATLEKIAGVASEEEEHINKLGKTVVRAASVAASGENKVIRPKKSNQQKRRTPQRVKSSGPTQQPTQNKKVHRLPKRQASESSAHVKRRIIEEMSSSHLQKEKSSPVHAPSKLTQSTTDMLSSAAARLRKANIDNNAAHDTSQEETEETSFSSSSFHERSQTEESSSQNSNRQEKDTLKKKKTNLSPTTMAAHDALTKLRSSQRVKPKKVRIIRTKSERRDREGRRELKRPTRVYHSESDKGEMLSPPVDGQATHQRTSVNMSPKVEASNSCATNPDQNDQQVKSETELSTASPVVKEPSKEINDGVDENKGEEKPINAQTTTHKSTARPSRPKIGLTREGSSLHRMRAHVRKKKNAEVSNMKLTRPEEASDHSSLSSGSHNSNDNIHLPLREKIKMESPSIRSHRSLPSDLEWGKRNEVIPWRSLYSPQEESRRVVDFPSRGGKPVYAGLSPHSLREQRSQDFMYGKMFTLDGEEENNCDLLPQQAASLQDVERFFHEGEKKLIGRQDKPFPHLLDDLSKNDPESEKDAENEDDDPLLHIDDMAMLLQHHNNEIITSTLSSPTGRQQQQQLQKSESNRSLLSMDSSIDSSDLDSSSTSEGTSENEQSSNTFGEISLETSEMCNTLKNTWESERSMGVQFPKMMISKDSEHELQSLTESINKLADEVLEEQVAINELRALSMESCEKLHI